LEKSEGKNMKESRNQLYVELQSIADQGIMLFLDGSPCTPEYAAHVLCAGEEACYMRDYVYDEKKGVLKELHFDKLGET